MVIVVEVLECLKMGLQGFGTKGAARTSEPRTKYELTICTPLRVQWYH